MDGEGFPKECASCGDLFDRGQIRKRSWVVGRRDYGGTTRTGSSNSSRSSLSGGSLTFSHVNRTTRGSTSGRSVILRSMLWVCNDCARRKLRGDVLKAFLTLAVIGIALLTYLFLTARRDSNVGLGTERRLSTASASATADGHPKPSQDTGVEDADRSRSTILPEPDEHQGASAPSASPAPSAVSPIPATNGPLREALMSALESGQAGRWNDGSIKGGVSVSAAQEYPGEVCRSYRYTVDGQGSDHDGTACKADGGSWSIAGTR